MLFCAQYVIIIIIIIIIYYYNYCTMLQVSPCWRLCVGASVLAGYCQAKPAVHQDWPNRGTWSLKLFIQHSV